MNITLTTFLLKVVTSLCYLLNNSCYSVSPMNMSVVELIKLGRKYMQLWPQKADWVIIMPNIKPCKLAVWLFDTCLDLLCFRL